MSRQCDCGVDAHPSSGTHAAWCNMVQSACANCGRPLDSIGSDHCAECDHMFEAGVEAAIAALGDDKALWSMFCAHRSDAAAERAGLMERVRRAVKR